MTDAVTGTAYLEIIKIILDLGPIGLVMVMAWLWKQQVDSVIRKWQEESNALMRQYQEASNALMRQYRDDTVAMGKMYENNVELVKRYEETSKDMKDVIILVAQNLQRLNDDLAKECR